MRGYCYSLFRKLLRFVLAKFSSMSLAESEHGGITNPEKFPEAATLYWFHTPTHAGSALNDASGAEANRLHRTTFRGTRVALEGRQKNVRTTKVARMPMTAGSKTVRHLWQPAVVSRILLLKHFVEK